MERGRLCRLPFHRASELITMNQNPKKYEVDDHQEPSEEPERKKEPWLTFILWAVILGGVLQLVVAQDHYDVRLSALLLLVASLIMWVRLEK